MSDQTDRKQEVLNLMQDNMDIIKKAAGRVSRVGVEIEDIFSEIYLRLDKHLDLDAAQEEKVFRMYMGKVTYHVTSAMIKSSHISTNLMAGGTSGSVRRLNYEELKDAQEDYFARTKHKYCDQAVDSNEAFGNNSFDDTINFHQDLETVLGGNALEVARLLSDGYKVREVSEKLNLEMAHVQNNLIPRIKHALTRMMGQDERSSR